MIYVINCFHFSIELCSNEFFLQFICQVTNASQWDVICHNNTIDCNRDQQQFAATTEIDLNKIEEVNHCLLFLIHKSYFSDGKKFIVSNDIF